MRHNVFNTPVLSPILRFASLLILKILGWRREGNLPDLSKYVVIGAFHTSIIDFPLAILFAFAYNEEIRWMGKHTIFRGPFRSLFLWMGGIPVNRNKPHGAVAQCVKLLKENEKMVVVIAPEGTRSKRDAWKSGFYYIASRAHVPMLLAFLDYRRKVVGVGPLITPSRDIGADMGIIADFYANVTPRRPDRATPPVLKIHQDPPHACH
jgi:1-acyl-sn-glycerol-3-phosphate acyltransferase